jgi:hypothetical protein
MGLLIKLQNSDTTLKSLKFGHDRPGGGSSNQPYIKTPIDRPDTPALNSDFLLRGGISAPLNAAEDVARLTKYFFDFRNPSGLLFTTKQNLLSRTGTKTEASFGPAYGGFSKGIDLKTGNISLNQNNGFFNEGIYTPLSTLAEAGVVAFGGHLNKQGIDPTGLIPGLSIRKYQDVVYDNNREERNFEDPKVPLSLVRKSQNASDRAGRMVVKKTSQDLKTQQELNQGPSQINLSRTSADTSTRNSTLQKSEQIINNFLKKWDAYRDKQAIKKLNRAQSSEDKAIDKSDTLFSQVISAENADKVFNNRLLKLWNGSGLNLSRPSNSISSVLYSYSGGPNSVLGFGNTDIRFATTNDGVTALRTNNLTIEDLNIIRKEPSFQTTQIFGNLYSPNPGVSLIYQEKFKISPFLTNPESIFFTGNPDNDYLEDYNLKSEIQPWVQNFIIPGESNEDPKTYLTGSQRQPETDLFTFPLNASSKYNENIDKFSPDGEKIDNNLITAGRNSYQESHNNNVYQPGTLTPITDIRTYNTLTQNKINALSSTRGTPVYKTKTTDDKSLDLKVYYNSSTERNSKSLLTDFNDLIDFNFTIINPTSPSSPGLVLDFRAYIDSFSDSYNGDWKAQTYMGRAEKFYKYNSFDRDISLGFTIVADNQNNLEEMYSQLNTLASSIAPFYTAQGYMAGVLHKLTVGNYVNKQYGILQGLTFEITDETPWQIKGGSQLPLYIKVTGITFKPIHNFRPEVNLVDKTLATNAGGQKYFVPSTGSLNQRYIFQEANYSDDVTIPPIENPSNPKKLSTPVSVTSNLGPEVGIQPNSVFNS